jgi:uroporphyrinogen-III synthase
MEAPPVTPPDVLRGFRIGVTSDRRSADLIAALERRGAQVLHAPALTIVPNDQDDSLIIETRRLIAARPEVVLVTTGYGMRRWLEVADAAGLGAELTAALEAARIFARGPKAHGRGTCRWLAGRPDQRPGHHGISCGRGNRRWVSRSSSSYSAPWVHR